MATTTETQTITPWIELGNLTSTSKDKPRPSTSIRSHTIPGADGVDDSVLPSPTTSPNEQPMLWNHPRSNLFKVLSAFFAFVVMGANDAALGVS